MHVAIDNVASACGVGDRPNIDILLLLLPSSFTVLSYDVDLSPPRVAIITDG